MKIVLSRHAVPIRLTEGRLLYATVSNAGAWETPSRDHGRHSSSRIAVAGVTQVRGHAILGLVDRDEVIRVLRAVETSGLEYVLIGAAAMGFHGLKDES